MDFFWLLEVNGIMRWVLGFVVRRRENFIRFLEVILVGDKRE